MHKIWLNLGLKLTIFLAVLLLTFLQSLNFRSMDDLDLLQVDCTSFLVSRASFLGCEAAKRATKSREIPRHIKSVERLFWKSVDDQFPDKRTETWYNTREKLRISMFLFTFTLKDIYHCERAQKQRIRAIVTKAVFIVTLCPSFSLTNSLTWRILLNLRFRTPSFTMRCKYMIRARVDVTNTDSF